MQIEVSARAPHAAHDLLAKQFHSIGIAAVAAAFSLKPQATKETGVATPVAPASAGVRAA